jgi:hypothetical protein
VHRPESGADLAQRHQHHRHRPRRGADVVGDAEAADRRLQAVADCEREDHPRADPPDEQDPSQPADAGERLATLVAAHMGREPGDGAERQAHAGQRGDQDQVTSGGRQRVDVLGGDPGDEHERKHEVAAVDPALLGLAEDDHDEQDVDQVIGGGHTPIIDPMTARVVGSRVEPRVDLPINPRIERPALAAGRTVAPGAPRGAPSVAGH